MKKALIIISLFLFYNSVHAQSLTLNDLLSMMKTSDAGPFLVSKGFESIGQEKTIQFFRKKISSPKRERIYFDTKYKAVGYNSYDTIYMSNMLKQIEKSYHKVYKYNQKDGEYYQFSNATVSISFNIKRTGDNYGPYGHIGIGPQNAKVK